MKQSNASRAARLWALIAVQYHQRMQDRGIPIPFPEVCFCRGAEHRYETQRCPVVGEKTHAARMKALGEVLNNA